MLYSSHPHRDRSIAVTRYAFTLTELLVIIGIITLLLGLILPSISRAMEQARRVRCQSNLRQWAMAVTLYVNENEGWLPRRGEGQQPTTILNRPEDWFNALPPIMGMQTYNDLTLQGMPPHSEDRTLWTCPDSDRSLAGNGPNYFSYAMNMALSTWFPPTPDRMTSVGSASTMVFLTEGPGPYCSVLPRAQPYSPVARHMGWINIAFLDGHVAAYPGKYVGCGMGDPGFEEIRWAVPGSSWPLPP